MSGGSMDYISLTIENLEFDLDTPARRDFRAHLQKVAKALHDIEWVDSGDYGPGDENNAILECLTADAQVLDALTRERDDARAEALEQARLNGMGIEREARLVAERDAALRKVAELSDAVAKLNHDTPGWLCGL